MNPAAPTSPTVLAVVTARGGSKGLPGKNVRPLAGRPLIAWTIAAAQAARCVRRVVVSTDDPGIAEVARNCGAEVPFLRPAALSRDDSTSLDVLLHALDTLEQAGGEPPGFVLLLQPTSPLRLAEDIDGAFALAERTGAEFVVSVTEANPHPFLAKALAADGSLSDFVPRPAGLHRRQDFPAAVALNGAIYLARPASLRARRALCPPGTLPFPMPARRSIDIDTAWDFQLAELILERGLHRP